MGHAHQRRLRDFIQHALVISLGAVELAAAFANEGHVDGYMARRLALEKMRYAEDQHQPLRLARRITARFPSEAHADAAVGRAHSPGAFRTFVAPIQLRTDRSAQARAQVSVIARQAAHGRRADYSPG